jgi:uncharacterized protein (DUF342 family)
MTEQIDRERKAWHEHHELLLINERTKFEENKMRELTDLKQQLSLHQERSTQLQKNLHEAQMVSLSTEYSMRNETNHRSDCAKQNYHCENLLTNGSTPFFE